MVSYATVLSGLTKFTDARTGRVSSYDITGRNADRWTFKPGETKTIADIKGTGCITHLWFTQHSQDPFFLRKVVLKIYWDDEENPSVIAPVGDFFCAGHAMTANFSSLPFTASTNSPHKFGEGVAFNCYLQMPFRKRARFELVNECDKEYIQYFYVDYELYEMEFPEDMLYFHSCWNRENPTPGWGAEINVNFPEADAVNTKKTAYQNNYRILDAKGKGHYIGCNISVSNFHGTWWGEGDEMIWIDGYKWPPDLHGTGSEDYLNQAWGMQPNSYLFNGSSIYEGNTLPPGISISNFKNHNQFSGGYQTSYIFHFTNPVRFRKELLVTIEHGHANHTSNDWCTTAYWYQTHPHVEQSILPADKRIPLLLQFENPEKNQVQRKRDFIVTPEMKNLKKQWKKKNPQ